MEKSRALVIGGTGHICKHIVAASLCLGHPTAVLIREFAPSDQVKVQRPNGWVNSSASLLKGDLFDHESLVKAIKCADVVISAVGPCQVAEQTRIIATIKEAGSVKLRFKLLMELVLDSSCKQEAAHTPPLIPLSFLSKNFFHGVNSPKNQNEQDLNRL
ncbi:hypothetical protein C2845_PM07G04030 [Panicum miliaceum]|uniref:NmrA-like domain-containing protein n=1 Tax=Panicum miliaceum TaxID=4540 RepID=A0A3L6SP63_PANMI|nr:hypothetical protein C2845_PM07G04030 [Panicum miliaceum]